MTFLYELSATQRYVPELVTVGEATCISCPGSKSTTTSLSMNPFPATEKEQKKTITKTVLDTATDKIL